MSTSVPPGSGEPDQPEQPDYSRPSEGFTQPIPPPPPPSAPSGPFASSGGYGAPPPPTGGHAAVPPPSAPASGGSYAAPPPSPRYGNDEPLVPGNFFGRLFDLSFRSFVTPSVVKILYVLAIVLIILGWLGSAVTSFQVSAAFGLFVLIILGPLYSLFMLILVRVLLEFYIAIIRVAEDVQVIKGRVET